MWIACEWHVNDMWVTCVKAANKLTTTTRTSLVGFPQIFQVHLPSESLEVSIRDTARWPESQWKPMETDGNTLQISGSPSINNDMFMFLRCIFSMFLHQILCMFKACMFISWIQHVMFDTRVLSWCVFFGRWGLLVPLHAYDCMQSWHQAASRNHNKKNISV